MSANGQDKDPDIELFVKVRQCFKKIKLYVVVYNMPSPYLGRAFQCSVGV